MKEFLTTHSVLDMVGRTCIRRCDNEKFMFLWPKDTSCQEFIMYHLSDVNKHKGIIPDDSVMLPTLIKHEDFGEVFSVDWEEKKFDVQIPGGIDTTSKEWKEILKRDAEKRRSRQ